MSDPDKTQGELQRVGDSPDVPEEQKDHTAGRSESVTQMFAAFIRQFRPESSITAKLTEDHITKSLDMVESQNERVAEDRKDQRKFWGTTQIRIIVGLLALVSLLIFTGNAQLIATLGECVVIGTVGAFGGYGIGVKKGSES